MCGLTRLCGADSLRASGEERGMGRPYSQDLRHRALEHLQPDDLPLHRTRRSGCRDRAA